MKGLESFVLIASLIFISLIVLWVYYKNKEAERKKKELEEARIELERKNLFDYFESKIDKIKNANIEFSKHINFETGYFANYQLTVWQDKQRSLLSEIKGKRFEDIKLSTENVKSIETFINYFTNSNKLRDNFNRDFVKQELNNYSEFFDDIEGRKLDIQQRTSVVTDEDNNIVIAGAGSGKTTTIVGKVNYVINRYKVNPDEILLISYTKKSASDLSDRINNEEVEVKTFHKFGKDIIVQAESKQPSIFEEQQFRLLLEKYFNDLIKDTNYLEKLTNYFVNFLKPIKLQSDFANKGEYIQYIKDQNFKSYKAKAIWSNGKKTFRMEAVKSIEECKIANFLLFNGIDYEYEFPYEYDTANKSYRQYKPDFTVKQDNKKIYIEHFGISRDGSVPNWFTGDDYLSATEKYQEGMEWKRELHEEKGTILIESYSYEMNEGTLFDNLAKNLSDVGVIFKPKSPEEIWEIISQNADNEVKNLIALFGTFITLMKSNNYYITDVRNKNNRDKDNLIRQRNSLFIEIITPIFERYEDHLKERNEIDFSDMINKASEHIINGTYDKKFSYIIIDEFQDISIGRYQLIKALKEKNPSCKVFCVGDDWQSIYRFSGSDISLFKEFENYFGYTVKSKIETTYRFREPLISFSSNFIQKNPNQAQKELKGLLNQGNTEYNIRYSTTSNQDDTIVLKNIFDDLLMLDENIGEKEIIILGRYRFDIDRIKNEKNIFQIDKNDSTISYTTKIFEGKNKNIQAKFMTVHKAKGLEGDIVIVLNCNSGKYGFPSEMSDDLVLNLLLSEADQFENGEERRLFYVAMTRAKEKIYFVADSSFKSKFISELEVESGKSSERKCPECITADVLLRRSTVASNGNTRNFYGCSNYLYGCEYNNVEWINDVETFE
ncbi:UvrD-helicase domain-containing protein [Bernardetia sp. OM2101]|uniref:UvrD-helicase domain-containing protein n=1 Tax=Bernardetia sp. OM2101 TaxID=3344876 RepID=UPI0035CFAA7C